MEGIVNWLLSIQLAFGPLVLGSELVRISSSPPHVIDLSTIEVREIEVIDAETGKDITIAVPVEIEDNASIISKVFDECAGILLAPTAQLLGVLPSLNEPFDRVIMGYIDLLD